MSEYHAKVTKGTTIIVKEGWDNFSQDTVERTVNVKVRQGPFGFYNEEAETVAKFLGIPCPRPYLHGSGQQPYLTTSMVVSYGTYPKIKYVKVSDIEKIEPPKKAERKDTGPTLRQRMQPGTKWKLTADAKYIISCEQSYTKGVPDTVVHGVAMAGSEIEVISFTTYGPGYVSGNFCCALVNGKKEYFEFKELNHDPEQLSEAEVVPVFCLRDKATGEFFQESEYVSYDPQTWERSYQLVMTTKWSKYRKWNRLSDVRAALLNFSGYYDNLPGSGNLPDWMGGPKQFDIPDTWEIVKFDKLTKKEVETLEAMDTFKRAWKLRDLTVKYGSAVRSTYSELEKKGKLDEFSAMLVFTVPEDRRDYWWNEGMTDEEKQEVKDTISTLNKCDVKVGKSTDQYAIAIKDVNTGVMLRLSYSGSLEIHLLDLKTLSEVTQ